MQFNYFSLSANYGNKLISDKNLETRVHSTGIAIGPTRSCNYLIIYWSSYSVAF